jgi:hypothetical protein
VIDVTFDGNAACRGVNDPDQLGHVITSASIAGE